MHTVGTLFCFYPSNSYIKYYCLFYINILYCASNAIRLIECAVIVGGFMDQFTMFP